MRYLLYKKEYMEGADRDPDVRDFAPNLFRLFLPKETRSWETALLRISLGLLTCWKTRIFYIESEEGKILHTSYVIPRCLKFPFMERGSYEIGPCQTIPEARRKGLYVRVLNHITTDPRYQKAAFYMIVRRNNRSSIGGIDKAGFQWEGVVEKTSFLRVYHRIGGI